MTELRCVLEVICDDLFFGVLGAEALDEGGLDDFSKKRGPAYHEAARGVPGPAALGDAAAWALALARDAAASCPPSWMPMSELVASGITLAGGARGVRSLFSSKPSEKEVIRVKRLGTLAFRALGAAIAADGEPSRDERSLLQMLLRSLALPPEEESLLAAAPLGDVTSVEIFGELEPKNAALVLRGAWQAALRDGLDAREEGALAVLASRLLIKPEEAASIRVAVEQSTEARRLLGRAVIDACYWLLGDDVALARGASSAAASLLLPDPERSAILAALAQGAPPASVSRAPLPRPHRAAALGAAWLVALRSNPTLSRKAALAARLDGVAKALDGDGPKARSLVESLVERRLGELAVELAP